MSDINWLCVAVALAIMVVPTAIAVAACMLSSKISQEEERWNR